ncbi:MAG: ATP-binding protein [Lachnospiraceae bacterium]|nr:ATP-binding protein [Lachnospiraceae bacterium]
MKKPSDVFTPGALPESTYITRKTVLGFTYEERLRQALNMNGYLTSISGPSKIGKTVLCEKVIGLDKLVEVSGSDFSEKEKLWVEIGSKAGMPLAGLFTSNHSENTTIAEEYLITRENVIDYYKENEYVLLLDDFHYADLSMQTYMAQQFKDAIRKGLKVIISSLPHRSDDAIRTNPDLQGRISIIDIEAWSKDELMEIPKRGFGELSATISDECIQKLVDESLASPQLMQLICLNICVLANIDKEKHLPIEKEIVEKAFRFSTLNLDYQKVAETIKQGKCQRGKERRKFKTKRFGEIDLYELILEAIADDPPVSYVGFENLAERINSIIIEEEKPSAKAMKDYLNNIQDVIEQKGRSYEVIEWREDVLYVIEALFIFYLRWGRA